MILKLNERMPMFLLTLLVLLEDVKGYKVLVVYPFVTPSIGLLGHAHARELLRKGHQVTYITNYPNSMKHENLTEIDVSSMEDIIPTDYLTIPKLLDDNHDMNHENEVFPLTDTIIYAAITHENVTALLRDTTQHFDVVVALWFYSELYAGFSAIYQCPLVWSSTMEADGMVLRLVDEVANPAYSTDNFSYRTQPFSFLQRVEELWLLIRKLYYFQSTIARIEQIYKDVFASAAEQRGVALPPYQKLIYNGSIVLANSHPSVNDAPKLPQNVKGIAGYHIDRTNKPLPKNLQDIMDKATDGVIYFSLGSYMKSKYLPIDMRNGILKVFTGLKQTVIWKFEEDLKDLPKNVHILKWAPQTSILAHANTKLFITHGGLLSTTETVHFEVPIIAIPLFVDQFLNMDRAVARGYAVRVKFSMNLASDLKLAISEVLNNSSYADRVKDVSSLYHDRTLAPADELVYWVEHAVRTRGAVHLRSPALLLPWYSRLYIDLLALVLASLLVVGLLVKSLWSFFRGESIGMTKQKSS